MLVLSRGRNDQVVFPSLGISVEILRIDGNKVRIGVDAPRDIRVLRHEVAERDGFVEKEVASRTDGLSRITHAMRNRLHAAALGLHVLHKKFEAADVDDAEEAIFKVFNELKAIEDELNPAGPAADDAATELKRRTLLVEDDANESELMAGYLRMSGFEVDTAMDGLQAMTHLAKHDRPDVVLMDMRMPRFDGKKAVTAIRANPDYQNLKIFAVSGTEQADTLVSVGPDGVNRWFSKPVNPQSIVEAINEELSPAHQPVSA